jgi:hypothetical protein
VCGEDPESPISDYEVVWDDIYTEDLEDQVNEPEYCHGCGRQLKYTVVWTDLPPMPPERKEREHDD